MVVHMNNKTGLKGLSVVVIENDPASLTEIERVLKEGGAQVYTARDSREVTGLLSHKYIDVIMAALDVVDEHCIEMIKDYKSRNPDSIFYVLTGREYDSVETSQESVRLVVDDYVRKPIDIARFTAMVQTSMGRPGNRNKSLTLIDPLIAKVKPYFIFRSPVMRRTLAYLPQMAASDQTVLITGETGSGKELVARAIHVLSRRSAGPFVPINCGAVPESLIEGELFGHEKGSFTGAVKTRKGKFEIADRGTLFLDEIGDMPLNLQVRLLRALEDGNIYRLGEATARKRACHRCIQYRPP
ncbi:MAG: sigma-54-dependent Fis family transcriptional regulator [Deferribacteres bacterium]|nr:sigma-54-dependent Fis family transcriptional regulator [Deferribacteres bacterium]